MPSSTPTLAERLLAWELAIARRDAGAVPAGLASLIDPSFFEFGSSGRVWSQDEIVASLGHVNTDVITIDGFALHPLADGVVLATYRMTETPTTGESRHRNRSSLWVLKDGRWVMCFHQGTPTCAPA